MRETKKMRETRESHAACAHASHQRLLQDHQRVLQDHQSLQESRRKQLANLLPSERIKAQQTHTTPVPAHAHPGRTSPRPFAPLTTPLTNCRSRGGKGGEILGCVSRCGCAEEKQTLCASTNQVCAVICRLIGYLVNALDLGNALELVNGLCQVSW